MKTRLLVIIIFWIIFLSIGFFIKIQKPSQIESNFKKISQQGFVMSSWAGPWSCIYDKKQNLLWENKTQDEGIHHYNWTYSWYQNQNGVQDMGDCFVNQKCDVQDLIDAVNHKNLCGQNNWRLPTTTELLRLVNHRNPQGISKIDQAYFPFQVKGDYWTSQFDQPLKKSFGDLTIGANAINFIDGNLITIPYRNAAFTRLVSSGFIPKNNKEN